MKIMTLNTHSLVEKNYDQKLEHFVDYLVAENPDIVALQEVNQTISKSVINAQDLIGYHRCEEVDVPIREDNHVANVIKKLSNKGIKYSWTWLPCKIGYDTYDEGLAILTREKIAKTSNILLSKSNDYKYWKTRRALGVYLEKTDEWFFSIHMGWWGDTEEPFKPQWETFCNLISKLNSSNVWAMGDFNSSDDVRLQGYDLICETGWNDTYSQAENKDAGYTVEEPIDGWRENTSDFKKMRLDYIWSRNKVPVKTSKVIFNGKSEDKISDHYGVVITTK